ncbi:M16 family metallopeptidase [Schlesneria paludicola]|uniref:M16 family metallopeptidase n=1 Tax=Schlesneria paludicola TaxID=360056 RepID=UPI00029A6DE4|nr:pitrilysin family protein [Schlesneria paludicola]
MIGHEIHHKTLSNGLTVLVETMPAVRSAAFTLLIPAGSAFDPAGQNGTASALADWITRGTGSMSSRELLSAFDRLGIQAHESASLNHLVISGACLSENLPAALRLYGEVIRHPLFNEDDFEAVMAGVEQSLLVIEDEPRQKVMFELVRRCFPSPWGKPAEGTLEDLEQITPDAVRQQFRRCVRPQGAILGIAGNVTLEELAPILDEAFGDWSGANEIVLKTGARGVYRDHLSHESTQTHIGVSYPAVPYGADDYYQAWAAVNVLSGGMSSRLFTEVREKRALCYSVYASLNSIKSEGQVLCYAGTTSERAQETLDVLLRELVRLGEGIEEEELARCKARAKSSLIMAQESTGGRAGSLARNWFYLGRIVTMEEVRAKIEALTTQTVLDYVKAHPAQDFTVLTIGPEPLVS